MEAQAIVLVPPLYEQSTPTAPNILETINQTYLAKKEVFSFLFFCESLKGWNVIGESKTQIVHFFKLFCENKFTFVKMQPKTIKNFL